MHKELDFGFLEGIHQEALALEFSRKNIPFEKEKELKIKFKSIDLNKKYIADFIYSH